MNTTYEPSAAELLLGDAAPGLLGATSVLAMHARLHNGDGAGLCLASVALLSFYARSALDLEVEAVCGTFAGEAHWWVRHGNVILDPTRSQFDDGPIDSVAGSASEYVAEQAWPAGWTSVDLAVAEAARAFTYPPAGRAWAHAGLAELAELPVHGNTGTSTSTSTSNSTASEAEVC